MTGKITYMRCGMKVALSDDYTIERAAIMYTDLIGQVMWFAFETEKNVYMASHNRKGINFTALNENSVEGDYHFNWCEVE